MSRGEENTILSAYIHEDKIYGVDEHGLKLTVTSLTSFTSRWNMSDHTKRCKQDHQRWISTVDKLQVVWQMDRLMANW